MRYLWKRFLRSLFPPRKARDIVVPLRYKPHYNEALRDDDDVLRSIQWLGWEHPTRTKTWDLLKAGRYVLEKLPDRTASILDAGCRKSPILELLYGSGYRNLYGCDVDPRQIPDVPGLRFTRADITRIPFDAETFDAITCISVIEHGVNLDRFFSETARVLKPGGHLLISTDFSASPVSTSDVDPKKTFQMAWSIFTRSHVEEFVSLARSRHSMNLIQPVRWEVRSPPVTWAGKTYTFIFLAFQKD